MAALSAVANGLDPWNLTVADRDGDWVVAMPMTNPSHREYQVTVAVDRFDRLFCLTDTPSTMRNGTEPLRAAFGTIAGLYVLIATLVELNTRTSKGACAGTDESERAALLGRLDLLVRTASPQLVPLLGRSFESDPPVPPVPA